MARFHVHRTRSGSILAIDLQEGLLDDLTTRVVAPLVPVQDVAKYVGRLNPTFKIDGNLFVMMTQHMGVVALSDIGDVVADLSARRDEIMAATDFLFRGF